MNESLDISAGFWDHVEELRRTFIRICFVIGIGIILSFFFYQEIFHFITKPLQEMQGDLQLQEYKLQKIINTGNQNRIFSLDPTKSSILKISENAQETAIGTYLLTPGSYLDIQTTLQPGLVFFSPLEGMIAMFKICFWVGLVCTSPFWLLLAMQFIAPALHSTEKKLILPFIGFSFLFLGVGLIFAFYLTIPLANQYLYAFNQDIGINLWSFTHYLDYSIILLLSNALAFEFALLLFFLVHLGVFTAEALASKRRIMIVMAFIVGAILTPPDVLTQFMLAIPLILFYEAAIVYAKLRGGIEIGINKKAAHSIK